MSHADRDHLGGLFTVLEFCRVGEVAIGSVGAERPLERDFLAKCAERGVPVRQVKQGDVIALDKTAIKVLHPPGNWPAGGEINDESFVLRVPWGGVAVLVTGDVENKAEATLRGQDLRAAILRIPHHGSATSSSAPFVADVAPRHAAISAGPCRGKDSVDARVLSRYAASNARVWRTDREGAIVAVIEDGGHPTARRARTTGISPLRRPLRSRAGTAALPRSSAVCVKHA